MANKFWDEIKGPKVHEPLHLALCPLTESRESKGQNILLNFLITNQFGMKPKGQRHLGPCALPFAP
uniref:Putative ovule protein n=1 Tax=Solanum chacoense TaxID=4108 RepID=A0A0V0HHN9_SOLCH